MRYLPASDGVSPRRPRARRRTAAPRCSAMPPGSTARSGSRCPPRWPRLRALGGRLPGPRRLRGAAGSSARRGRPSATTCWPSSTTSTSSPGRCLGVGHSMGGAALLLAEQARPGTFAGLWLFEPIVPPPGARPRASTRQQPPRRRRRTAAAELPVASPTRWPTTPRSRPSTWLRADALHAYVRHGFVAGEDGAVHLACRPADEARVFRGAGRTAPSTARRGRLPGPVVVGGDEPSARSPFAPAIADGAPPRPARAPRAPQPLRAPGGARPSWRPRSRPSPPTL